MGHGETQPSQTGAAPRSGLLSWPGGELDLRSTQVRRDGVVLALDRSSFEVLLALLARAGQVLSKDDLLEAAWPGRVVSENSLAKAISRLRRELGDDASAPLQSVHGYGYRWAGEVQWRSGERPTATDVQRDAIAEESRWIGTPVPMRPGWTYRRVLGRSDRHLALLAESEEGDPPRALKLGLGEDGLRHVRREVALHRYLASVGTPPSGLAPALGWQLEQVPVFVEYPYFEEGDLWRWIGVHGAAAGLGNRLALLAQVADTLAELHAAGVVHQGLGPENVFLCADPARPEGWRTALTDLGGGYAFPAPNRSVSAVDVDALGAESIRPDGGAEVPAYAAPEVVGGALPTQRSDLYALGVLLYQMVVGDLRRPLAPGWEVDVEDPLLREDIGALTALRPEDRHLGAATLAEGLRTLRQRRQQRLEARKAESQQREVEAQLQRQQRRLRLLGVAAAALFAGLALAGWTGWLALEARADEQRRYEEAQAVLGFLTSDLLTRADPYQGGSRDVSLRDALDGAAARIDERLGASPETAAAVHDAIAGAYEGWGDFARAAEQRRQSLALALETPGTWAVDLAARQRQICDLERQAGALEPAVAACAAAAEADRARDGVVSVPTAIEWAKLDEERGRCTEAVATLQPIVDGGLAVNGVPPAARAEARWYLGRCRSRLAEDAAAIDALRVAVQEVEDARGADHSSTAWALADFAGALTRAGRFEEASAALDRLSSVFAERRGARHPDAQLMPFGRARIAAAQGRHGDAAPLFGDAFGGWSRALGRTHPLSLMAASEQALALARDGKTEAAALLLARVQLEAPRVIAARGSRAADFHELWAETLLLLGRAEDAQAELDAFEKAGGESLPAGHPRLASIRCLGSWSASLRGDSQRAGTLLTACRIGMARFAPSDHRRETLMSAENAITAFGDGRSAVRRGTAAKPLFQLAVRNFQNCSALGKA
jgi:non-specific serine/threonine protein kinase